MSIVVSFKMIHMGIFVCSVTDITGGRAKTIVVVLFELFWSIGLILLPAVSMFFSNWSNLYLVISLPTLVLVFLHR